MFGLHGMDSDYYYQYLNHHLREPQGIIGARHDSVCCIAV